MTGKRKRTRDEDAPRARELGAGIGERRDGCGIDSGRARLSDEFFGG